MSAVRSRLSRPDWWSRLSNALRLLVAPRPRGRRRFQSLAPAAESLDDALVEWVRRLPLRPRNGPPGLAGPEFGPPEAAAVEKALAKWVDRQQSDAKAVPARRVDSD